jgi:small subunit ribosomal protein S21
VQICEWSEGRDFRHLHIRTFGYPHIYFVFLKHCFIFAVPKNIKGAFIMLIIDSKDCENIDKALKKYKKKFEKARILLQLRSRQSFTKPSVKRRNQVLKAVYKQQLASGKFED